jgi:hypothetical protein
MIDYGCPNYVGDEDCNKCMRFGYVFSCGGCDEKDKKEVEE